MRLYIAGPMTGLPEYNYPAFAAAEHDLRAAGHEPINPARRPVIDGWTWVDYMRPALRDVADADGLCFLPSWESSRGASLEVHIARTLGLPTGSLEGWLGGAA